jgi:branched-chain amino acid transport system permease protein
LSIELLLQSLLNSLVSSGLYILLALGLTLALSIMGIPQLSHGEIYMVGAFFTYFFVAVLGLNFFLGLFMALILVGGFGIFLERFCFRPARDELDRALIIAMGLILVLQNAVLAIAGGVPKSFTPPFQGALHILGVSMSWHRLLVVLVSFGLVLALFFFIRKTKTGQAMLAISQERAGAALLGISINRISAVAMFLGCALAAVAGGLVGPLFTISPTMGSVALMNGLAVIILGGLGSIPGAVVGGLILGFINGFMPVLTTSYIASLTGFGTIIIILIFRPQGIWGHEG